MAQQAPAAQRTRVKVCGITDPDQARAAVAAGADAIGLALAPVSKRFVTVHQAQKIASAVAGQICVVGFFVNPEAAAVQQALAELPLDILQFHGTETPRFCDSFTTPYCKALPAEPETDPLVAAQPYSGASYLMLDAMVNGQFGGTGARVDPKLWPAVHTVDQRWVLAGGLDAGNVCAAVTQLRPYAVDVSTGVEVVENGQRQAGIKDPEQMAAFVAAVRQADKITQPRGEQ